MFELRLAQVRSRNGTAHPCSAEAFDFIFMARKAIVLSPKERGQAQNDCDYIRAHRSEIETRSQLDLAIPADAGYLSKLRAGDRRLNATESAAIESVQELRTKLEPKLLAQFHILLQADIFIPPCEVPRLAIPECRSTQRERRGI